MKKKLLFVVDNLVMGGVTSVLLSLLSKLNYDKYEADLLVLHYHEDTNVVLPEQLNLIKGDKTYAYIDRSIGSILAQKDIKALLAKLSLVFSLKTGLIKGRLRRSRSKILSSDYDTEIAFNDGFTQIFVAQGSTRRKIAWLHADISVYNDSARYTKLISLSLKAMDAFVCVSKQVKAAYTRQYGIQNAHVIHHIMDVPKILRGAEFSADISFDSDYINLISVGRLCEAKNYSRFIRVHKMLLEKGYPVRSYIVGDGEDRAMLEEEISRAGVNESFTLLGRRENPFPYVKQADVFVLSSDHEGLPTVLLEALILGVPCVSTHVSGADELINEDCGIITDVDDTELFEGIAKMISGDKLCAYRHAAQNYNYSVSAELERVERIL